MCGHGLRFNCAVQSARCPLAAYQHLTNFGGARIMGLAQLQNSVAWGPPPMEIILMDSILNRAENLSVWQHGAS
ncbi:protein of unknown function [Taphrina deformans PYCC 5710]|uniref:Uncharacterized protein n=1 Tax=Taphrina deformans (strain PYCC 5710 / ATCC 11124 / CBS 356.35 / IMI 108563 / JCM 9778 / NBRC 8474) TaxID=1097556 RepID=R4X857_TAPDE|nr:protein of unknown function [Taphrina deformans PYCC 5710]|eukprot:CCG81442.1 protein of unknown function [Taphrina deformans PYCC 5710]